jgi:peptidoglycan-associated lipoprotein
MNLRRVVSLVALVMATVIVLEGCNRRVPPPAPPPPEPPAAPAPPPAPRPLTEDEIFSRKSIAELNAERPLSEVLFDYDMSAIRADAQPILQKNAEYLRRWPSVRVTIEGHADSRGTNEYNLGLGDRRATAVRDYLVSLGITADRLLGVSKGEETPVCTEENEACWQRNRRGAFIITAK